MLDPSKFDLAVNHNFDNEVNKSINKLQNIINAIPGLIYNNCGNSNSLLNQDGINKCGLQKELDKLRANGNNTEFEDLNPNLKTKIGKEILLKLIQEADVLVENFRPGVMEKLKLGWKTIKKANNKCP